MYTQKIKVADVALVLVEENVKYVNFKNKK